MLIRGSSSPNILYANVYIQNTHILSIQYQQAKRNSAGKKSEATRMQPRKTRRKQTSQSLRHWLLTIRTVFRVTYPGNVNVTSHKNSPESVSRQECPHNLLHFLQADNISISTGKGTFFPSPNQSFPSITFPVSQLPHSAQTHISVIITIISQERLVIKHVATNASREGKELPFPYF